jgi:hypothetical protein
LTVKELKEKLEKIPDNALVYLEYIDELGPQKELLFEVYSQTENKRKKDSRVYVLLS